MYPWWVLACLVLQVVCFGISLWIHWRSYRYRADALALLERSAQTRAETAALLAEVEGELREHRGEAPPPMH